MKKANIHYEITFEPDLKKFRFKGKETITFSTEATKKIILNAADLDINECLLLKGKNKIRPKIKLDNKNEELILIFSEKILGECKLVISFEGTHNDQLIGFYRSKYSVNGKEKHMVTTQFEAADARRAFPSWDSPQKKATFDISMIVEKDLTAISNMPVKEEKIIGNKKIFTFETTPLMSTYLLYLAVGEFEYVEDKANPVIRVYTTPGKKEHGKFALELGRKFLNFYENYFKIPYPLPKMDMIAIPDFAAGAMENWGAITYRENALLFDIKFSSTATKQRIAEIIAHEIAHQWFGNLVTMEWWNDLWLNESFATYMATKAVDSVFPEFDFWSQFLSDSTEAAMRLDALKSSHPIEVKVNTPKEIAEIFDDISYDKGGSILRMLNYYIGEKDFIEGIKNYLKKFMYGNTKSEDLWKSFEEASGKPVIKMLKNWIKKTGYPLVEVSLKGNTLKLVQSRFLLEKTSSDDLWNIPINMSIGDKQITLLLDSKTKEVKAEKNFKLNTKQVGFYRVKYPKLDIFKKDISQMEMSNMDRWGIQNDLFSLCVSGANSVTEYLEFVDFYKKDNDFLVLSDIQDNLHSLYFLGYYEPFKKKIEETTIVFLRKNFKLLGWQQKQGEPHTYAMLRSKTISFLGKLGDEEINKECRKRFEQYLNDSTSLIPDLQAAVFNSIAWNGNEKEYSMFMRLYETAQTQEEKVRFLGAISNFKDEKCLNKTFDFMLSDKIRYSDIIYPIAHLSGNPYAKKMLWPWMKNNWKILSERLGDTKMLLRRVIGTLRALSDMKSEQEIKTFFKTHPTHGLEMTLAQTLEKIRINSKLVERMRKEFS